MTPIEVIARCINDNYIYPYYTNILRDNDRNIVKDFNGFVNNIFNKLDKDFELYKIGNDFVIFKRDEIYILLEYIFVSFNDIEYDINMY